MRAYADTSFLVKLLSEEPGAAEAVAEYRRLHRPRLFYLPLHALEVENAIRHRAFHERRVRPAGERHQQPEAARPGRQIAQVRRQGLVKRAADARHRGKDRLRPPPTKARRLLLVRPWSWRWFWVRRRWWRWCFSISSPEFSSMAASLMPRSRANVKSAAPGF